MLVLALLVGQAGCGGESATAPDAVRIVPLARQAYLAPAATAQDGPSAASDASDAPSAAAADPLALADGVRADVAPEIGLWPAGTGVASGAGAGGSPAEAKAQVIQSARGGTAMTCVFFNMRQAPCSDADFRQAVARLVDREAVAKASDVTVVPSQSFVPPLSDAWLEPDATAPDLDRQAARQHLATARSKDGAALERALHILSPDRDVSPAAWRTAELLAEEMNGMGLNAVHVAVPDALLAKMTMARRMYDLYVADVTLAPSPFGLHALFLGSQDVPWTSAYAGVHDDALDEALTRLWSGSDRETARQGALDAQKRLAALLPCVPVCTRPERLLASSALGGFVNRPGDGADNLWTWCGLRWADAGKGNAEAVMVATTALSDLNPLTADTADEWRVLRMIGLPLLDLDPVTLEPVPVLAKSWDIGEWTGSDGEPRTRITFTLRRDAAWQDGKRFTASDVVFMIETVKRLPETNFHALANAVDSAEATRDDTVTVYFKDRGYRRLFDMAWFTLLPAHLWASVDDPMAYRPWETPNPEREGLTCLVGTGAWRIQADGIPAAGLSEGLRLNRSAPFHTSTFGRLVRERK